jgi:hypothetical protein
VDTTVVSTPQALGPPDKPLGATGATNWSITSPSSPAMNPLRVMVTDGYVVIGGGAGSPFRS